MKPSVSLRIAAACATILASSATASSQEVLLDEDFEDLTFPSTGEGPPSLVQRGWTFRNQSQPLGGWPAFAPDWSPGRPNTGSGAMISTSSATANLNGQLSCWAILPVVTGQTAGSVLTLWVMGGGHQNLDTFFDVRYSPGGGTGTGSGPFDVGDFTEVLFSGELDLSAQPLTYTEVSVVLPGSGPVALRFHAPQMSSLLGQGTVLWIDTLTVADEAPLPCGLPWPATGETETWTSDGSPYTVCQDMALPAGATLVVEAGTSVVFQNGRSIDVQGTLLAQGTTEQPVSLVGDNVSGLRSSGVVRLAGCDVDAQLRVATDGTLEVFDSVLRPNAWLTQGRTRTFLRMERCELRSQWIDLSGTSVLEEVTVSDPLADVDLRGFWSLRALESVAPLAFTARMQDRVVDHVKVTGVPGPALELLSPGTVVDYRLGPDNVLTGNDYPVWIRHGGLTPDSTVPMSGNVNDAILGTEVAVANLRSRVTIPDLGLPYDFLGRGSWIGEVRIDPGTLLRFGPNGGLTIGGDKGTDASFRGLPGAPVRLEPLTPGVRWLSLSTGPGWHVFEHLEIDGAMVGAIANECELFLRDCVISDCAYGAYPSAQGNLFGSGVRILGNDVGLQNDTSNLQAPIGTGIHFSGTERPNVFAGNLLAANNVAGINGTLYPFRADGNWWNHPTGPFEPNFHPEGQGDPVDFGVDFEPFLTSPPDLSDARPVVRLKTRLHPVVVPGERIFIEWDAFDDGAITSFDVQVLDSDVQAPAFTFIELASGLPPSQRRFELVVPDVGLHTYERFPFRIVAHDDAGNTGFEQFWLIVPHQAPAASMTYRTPLGTFRGGEDVTVCYDVSGLSSSFARFYLETGADDRVELGPSGHPGTAQCTFSPLRLPYASTDRARIALRSEGNANRDEWYFSEYFTIRPDPRIDDAPPSVAMTSPAAGTSFSGGGSIPIAWTADDDHGLREFRIQASFNGGYTFHTIETSLPPTARSHDWRLPASSGIVDLRVRVVAVDTRMQNTSDGDERVLSVHANKVPRHKLGPPGGPR